MNTNKRINNFKVIPELGYIMGVYFGDGSIVDTYTPFNHGKAYFSLTTIDKEFAEYVKWCFELFVGKISGGIISYQDDRKGRKLSYILRVNATDFCRQVRDLSKDKTSIPDIIYKNKLLKKSFVEGFFDSEGWVSQTKHLCLNPKSKYFNNYMFRVGFGSTSPLTIDIAKFMMEFGVDVNTLKIDEIPSGKSFYRYFPNIESFINAGFDLHINRKRWKLGKYRILYMNSPETTNRDPIKDYGIVRAS